MLSSPFMASARKLSPQPSRHVLNRHIRLPEFLSWTMALPNPFLLPVGRTPLLRFFFFAFPRTREFQPPETQASLVRRRLFSHASTRKSSPNLTGSLRVQTTSLMHPAVGACYTRLVSATPDRILTRWRMRFLEAKFAEQSGLSEFAPGHAVLFRKEALDAVGGYDVRYRLHHEDSDICQRMRKSGWETHYVAGSRCVSVQKDTLKQLAAKELRES
jgi:hypothetical protein